MRLIIPEFLVGRMEEQVEAALPEECCGLLAGVGDQVREVWPMANVAPVDRRRRYEVAVVDLVAAQKQARSRGWRILGVYHSHPEERAYFSARDRENAVPWLVYAIRGADGWRVYDAAGNEGDLVVV